MKREAWFTLLSGFFFALLVSFSCTACIASAFDLHIQSASIPVPVDLKALLVICVTLSLLMSIFHTWRLGFCSILVLLLLFIYFWFFKDLKLSLEALCNAISIRYHNAYDWGILRWSTAPLSKVDKTLALQILAAPICATVTWTVCRRQELVWALFAAILPIIPCTIITTTVPDASFLGLWLLALVLLFLTQSSRKQSARQGNRLLAMLALPVALAVVLLFHFVPQEDYDGTKTADALLQKLQALFSVSSSDVSGSSTKDSIDLSNAGNQRQRHVPVMTINAPEIQTYYLRGKTYDTYTGLQWKNSGKEHELPWNTNSNAYPVGTFHITTRYQEDVLYYPYASISSYHQPLTEPESRYLENEDDVTQYDYDIYEHYQPNAMRTDSESLEAFTYLPEKVHAWADEAVSDIVRAAEQNITYQDYLINGIKNYVARSAEYSLKTPRMSADYDDFAQWFLEESDTGYCVHFATAATVLLRAAGVPARYVTGYSVQAVAGVEVTVYQSDAHAWVEYWEQGYGWLIMDPTPAAAGRPANSTMQPTTTEASSQSTQPTTTSDPTESSKPSTGKRPSVNTPSAVTSTESNILPLLWNVLKSILLVLLPIVFLWAQWRLRLILRQNARRRGSPKERALRAWRQSEQFAHVLGEKPDKVLRNLTEKAKFSPHSPSEEELRQFDAYFRTSITALKSRPIYKRIYARLILALY